VARSGASRILRGGAFRISRGGAFPISRGGAYFYYAAARLGLFAAAYKTNPTPQSRTGGRVCMIVNINVGVLVYKWCVIVYLVCI
jgi:hypothetical protein